MITKDTLADLFDLTGRVAIVTGGSRGIGRSIAQAYAASGAHVVVASRKLDACEETAAEIRSAGYAASAVAAHMGRPDQIERLVESTVGDHGRLDIIVNNAANPLMLGVGALTEEAWSKALDANLRGPVFLVQAALPHLEASGKGVVINVLSNAAFMYSANHLLYPVAKAGLGAATR